jgi:hypothetical protein
MTRAISLKGQGFAADALTTIPTPPVAGVPYRDTAVLDAIIRQGWPFSTIVDSAAFNEAMYRISGLVNLLEIGGLLEWSALTDYIASPASYVKGADGIIYKALLASGPNSGGTKDCNAGANPTYWTPLVGNGSAIEITDDLNNHIAPGDYVINVLNSTVPKHSPNPGYSAYMKIFRQSGISAKQIWYDYALGVAGQIFERDYSDANGWTAWTSNTAGIGFPDWGSPTSLSSGTTYTAAVSGWVFIEPTKTGDGVVKCYMTINGSTVHIATPGQYNDNTHPVAYIPIKVGDVYTYTTPSGVTTESYKFYPNR